uniref:Secreted protein n=1 Tax=Arundo donax TaxID=35708 RepID=A0A0A9GGW6_ARUDO
MCSMMAAASICPGWCFSLWVRWSVYSGLPVMTSQKTAERTSARMARTLASKSTVDARPEPTAVPFTMARPSLGCSSKNPCSMPAILNASAASTFLPSGATATEFWRPVMRPAM